MHKRKKRKTVSKDALAPVPQAPYPGCDALSDDQKAAAQDADKEGLSFRVDLPSRRWLEQAAANSAASPGR
ncbi:MAG: hypothetical protein MUP47_02220 [Phycisphaerae bacterium]|nr:hypothetical protein [Phycisphaerae bacterium]